MDTGLLKFKYHVLDAKGNSTGLFATKGEFDGEFVTLGKQRIPASAIIKCLSVNNRIVLLFAGAGKTVTVPMQISKGNVKTIARAFNTIASVYQTQARQTAFEAAGKGHLFRTELCPHCRCVIDLTGMPATPQVLCPFCDCLATLPTPLPDEASFSLCSRCNLYSQPKTFTIAYFYFLLVVYGYSYKRLHLCNVCVRNEAWKMLAGNFLFVLFVPVAIVQLIRAYAGGATRSPTFQGLDSANAHHLGGTFDAAAQGYERIEQRLPAHAGVLFNHGRLFEKHAKPDDAIKVYERALAACSNYTPAARALIPLYERTRRTDAAARLKAQWETDPVSNSEADPAPPEPASSV